MGYNRFNPSCCCCLDIYDMGNARQMHVLNSGVGSYIRTNAFGGDTNARSAAFDFVNKQVYCPSNSLTNIYAGNQDLSIKRIAYTLTGNLKIRNALAVNPWGQHAFYGCRDDTVSTTTVFIRRVNFDDSGDTAIVTRATGAVAPIIQWITTSKVEQYVFYSEIWTGHSNLRRCNSDGSGDVLIFDGSGVGNINQMCVDNVGKYLFFDFANSDIYRCDFAGAGAVSILNRNANIPPLPTIAAAGNYIVRPIGWSHKNSLLYLSTSSPVATATPTGSGLFSCDHNGGNITAEVVYPNIVDSVTGLPTPTMVQFTPWIIGCGYEQTGADTLGS